MRICLPLFVLLFACLPLWGNNLPEPEPLFGLKWGMNQKQVEEVLAKDDNLLPHGTYLILQAGSREYHCRRYGTYLLLGTTMDMVCGFDPDYTKLEMISLRYTAPSYDHALAVYDKIAEYLSLKLLGTDRSLRSRERRPLRQDLVMDWQFPNMLFNMRVWGSDAKGQVAILLTHNERK